MEQKQAIPTVLQLTPDSHNECNKMTLLFIVLRAIGYTEISHTLFQ